MPSLVPIVALTAALGTSEAGAQPEGSGPALRLGVFGGWKILDSEIELGNSFYPDQVPESAFLLGGHVALDLLELAPEIALAPVLGAELEGTVAFSRVAGDVDAGREDDIAPVFGWRAHGTLTFLKGHLQPIILLGVGGETVATGSDFIDSPDTDAAMHWGVDLRLRATKVIDGRIGYRQIITAGRFDYLSLNHELHFGLSFRLSPFGGTPPPPPPAPVDEDGDGLIEGDKCPTEPEDKDGFEDEDGCPDPDNDSDGVADGDDKCPVKQEDSDGFKDDDGCPDLDNDLDFILDKDDKCPNEQEDPDGFEDEDGCPDLDNDGDGRADKNDSCPLNPETLNGFQDEDGCPDTVPKAIARFTGTIKGIRFASGSSRIVRSSNRTLNAAVRVLKKFPTIRIEISGHTDDTGSRTTNTILSRARAASVKKYIVGKGVADDRVTTIGYGPDKPVASNKTRRGKSKNRRIEFRLLPGPQVVAPAPPAAPAPAPPPK